MYKNKPPTLRLLLLCSHKDIEIFMRDLPANPEGGGKSPPAELIRFHPDSDSKVSFQTALFCR